ncbi:MAG: hypothetical protein NC299_04740 [Lachnospiraceae bacterium]|nr:hypothetical protein [Ruminococcus sp.]MCM1274656.1 hypothetical protein [Lachnospiraceae bacterium]
MKKFTAIICTTAMLAAFTGCNNETSESIPENSVSAPESTPESTSESIPESTSESAPESSSPEEEYAWLSDEARETLAKIFETYDGMELSRTLDGGVALSEEEISDVYYISEREFYCIEYDACTYRIARPLYDVARGSDYEELSEFLYDKMDEYEEGAENITFIKAKAGDVLENGLTVKEAKTVIICDPLGGFVSEQHILFDGELTIEGVLFREIQDHDYRFSARDLTFYPDCSKTAVPCITGDYNFSIFGNTDENYAVITDSDTFCLGNLEEIDFDEDGIFGEDNAAVVRVAVDDIRVGSYGLPDCTAHIVDVERIDDK